MSTLSIAHLELCARLMMERRVWVGRWSGRTPCENCGQYLASQGHHLIVSKARMSGAPLTIKHEIYTTPYNVLLVCPRCHTRDGLEPLRDLLICEHIYPRYGRDVVEAWIEHATRLLGAPVPMPGRLCQWCVHREGCRLDCDGQQLFRKEIL